MFVRAAFLQVLMLTGGLIGAQQDRVINVTEEQAAGHRLRSVEPEYPAFAKAAGIEGSVSVCAQIGADGHVQGMFPIVGPTALRRAAEKSLQQSLYAPFQIDGRPTAARAWVKVRFQLPAGIEAHTYPTPSLSPEKYYQDQSKDALLVEFSSLSRQLKEWLRKTIADDIDGELPPGERDAEVDATVRTAKVYSLQSNKSGARLYLFSVHSRYLCGDGNCPWILAEQRGAEIVPAANAGGWGFALYQRRGAVFPDILFASHMSAFETEIDGYGYVNGIWGELYSDVVGKRPIDEPKSPFLCKP